MARLNPEEYVVFDPRHPFPIGDNPYILHNLHDVDIADILSHYASYQSEVSALTTKMAAARESFQAKVAEKLAARAKTAAAVKT